MAEAAKVAERLDLLNDEMVIVCTTLNTLNPNVPRIVVAELGVESARNVANIGQALEELSTLAMYLENIRKIYELERRRRKLLGQLRELQQNPAALLRAARDRRRTQSLERAASAVRSPTDK
jgi:hypothetical protein